MLYIKSGLQIRVLKKETEREWLLLEIMPPNSPLVGVSYRCERKFSKDSHCECFLEGLTSLNKPEVDFIVAGDFNIALSKETKHSVELLDVMKSVNIKVSSPLEPTRLVKESMSCLGIMFSLTFRLQLKQCTKPISQIVLCFLHIVSYSQRKQVQNAVQRL